MSLEELDSLVSGLAGRRLVKVMHSQAAPIEDVPGSFYENIWDLEFEGGFRLTLMRIIGENTWLIQEAP